MFHVCRVFVMTAKKVVMSKDSSVVKISDLGQANLLFFPLVWHFN